MLGKLLARFRSQGAEPERDELDALEMELARPPEERDIDTLFPIILPRACLARACLADDWPGPIVPVGSLPFAVAWATVPIANRFIYVTHELAAFWRDKGMDWKSKAMRNLAALNESRPWAGEKCDEAGKPFVLALLHDDAMGPSRLLIPHLFERVLGSGYRVAIPEQTCAVAYRADLNPQQLSDVSGMIDGCFRQGTEPMSPARFDPAAFWIFEDGDEATSH
jgi:hypothetical protein